MIYPIVKYGDPILESPAKRIEKIDQKLADLAAHGQRHALIIDSGRTWFREPMR